MNTISIETTSLRIYVACLAAYNNGYLHGAWIEAAQDPWAIWDEIRVMLARSPIAGAEEFAIHDYEGFGSFRIAEYADIEKVTHFAQFIGEHGALGAALLDYYGADLDAAREAITERYLGSHASLADYMQELTEETITIPEPLRYYMDWQAMARDAELSGGVIVLPEGYAGVHVFAAG